MLLSPGVQSNPRTQCAEPKMSVVAGRNPSTPSGISVVWRGDTPNKSPYDLGSQIVSRDIGYYPEMDMCATCKTNVPVMNETLFGNRVRKGDSFSDFSDTPGRKSCG